MSDDQSKATYVEPTVRQLQGDPDPLPADLTALRAGIARLVPYLKHAEECEQSLGQISRGDYSPTVCDCGLVDALAALMEEK